MEPRRIRSGNCRPPFPVYEQLVDALLSAHTPAAGTRDAIVAHVLGTCAGYAYSDIETVATIMTRLGLESNGCVCVAQTVDVMFIFSTAFLVQSRCGRVVILCYRGTEPTELLSWLGDADVGSDYFSLVQNDARVLRVHAGFHRNVRATRWAVLEELQLALQGRSLADPEQTLSHGLEALYVTGHSLGGAMAALFALTLDSDGADRAVAEKLRAVYTYGQPLVTGEPLPPGAAQVAEILFRHVRARDPMPALPPAAWGKLAHFGHEYRYADGRWEPAEVATSQLAGMKELPKSVLALIAPEKNRASVRYTIAEHAPHHYIAALRPQDRVTEFGDQTTSAG
jgi:hypothetical protein